MMRIDAWTHFIPKPFADLEQVKMQLVAADTRVLPQDVVTESRQLADQLHPDQPSADHDNRE